MNLKTYYNLQSTEAIFFIKHTSSLGGEEASSSFNSSNSQWCKVVVVVNGEKISKIKKLQQ